MSIGIKKILKYSLILTLQVARSAFPLRKSKKTTLKGRFKLGRQK